MREGGREGGGSEMEGSGRVEDGAEVDRDQERVSLLGGHY